MMPYYGYGFYYDPTYFLVLIGVIVTVLASARVNGTYAKYARVRSMTEDSLSGRYPGCENRACAGQPDRPLRSVFPYSASVGCHIQFFVCGGSGSGGS